MSITVKIYAPDLSKGQKWFISWNEPGKGRIRKYENINTGNTYQARMELAEIAKKKYETLLGIGYRENWRARVQRFLEKKKINWRTKTYQTYKSKFDVFTDWLGDRKLTENAVLDFFEMLQFSHHPNTVANYREKLAYLFSECKKEHLFFSDLTFKRVEETSSAYFQENQIQQLKKYMLQHNPKLWLICLMQYYCAIRPGEIRELMVYDVDIKAGKIKTRNSISKNKKSQFVNIPSPFLPIMKRVVNGREPNEILFPYSKHQPRKKVPVNFFGSSHRRILKELDYPRGYSLYSWKHTGAVAIARTGISIKKLQIHFRHHSLDQTDAYLKQLGIDDLDDLVNDFPPV